MGAKHLVAILTMVLVLPGCAATWSQHTAADTGEMEGLMSLETWVERRAYPLSQGEAGTAPQVQGRAFPAGPDARG